MNRRGGGAGEKYNEPKYEPGEGGRGVSVGPQVNL